MLRFVRDARARRARRVPLPQPRAGRSLADTQGECTAPALWTGARDTPSMRPMPPSGPSPDSASGRAAERRRWTRARADWPITIDLEDGRHEARVRDVSRSGVCFFLDRPVREMTLLRVEFELPVRGGVRRVCGSGVVVRCERIATVVEHYEIAVFVQDMAPPDRDTIASYVAGWRASGAAL